MLALLVADHGVGFAGDFVLSYAIDAYGSTETGKIVSCFYEKMCEARGSGLHIRLIVHSRAADPPWLDLDVLGPPGCCYSADELEHVQADVSPGLLRMAIYRHVKRNPDEFVRNAFIQQERIGTIYLEFSGLH